MKRKKKSSGGANWMDTYGDMVTLLLCFFVLLYSMSTISQDNWRAIVMSFNPSAAMAPTETSGNLGPMADPLDPDGLGLDQGLQKKQEQVEADMQSLYENLKDYVQQQGNQSSMSVTKGDGKVFISFNQTVFFDAESPVLRKDSYPILDSICTMLDQVSDSLGEVRIQGHTAQGNPNKPNDVTRDRWLSSNRAVNVVIYMQEHSQVAPSRLISEGVGQWRPVASNATSEGRAKNRRVEMIISGRNLEQELKDGITSYEVSPYDA